MKRLSFRVRFVLLPVTVALLMPPTAGAQSALVLAKSFSPSSIGPGSVSTLEFNITNITSTPADSLAFSDTLPVGVTLATPANASSTCGGSLSAPNGGGTISLGDGTLAPFGSCRVRVDVTSSSVGLHTNVSGIATSSAGAGGPATADLVVATDRPGFSKSFSPSSLPLGGRSTLTFTIDNSANGSAAQVLTFNDALPPGMQIADPAKASSDCTAGVFVGGGLSATPGSGSVGLTTLGGTAAWAVAAGGTCTVTVDVVGNAAGELGNVSGELTSQSPAFVSSGKASAVLEVTATLLGLRKSFTDDPVTPGSMVTLEFGIDNRSRDLAATSISFDDDLEAVVSGLAPAGALPDQPCGASSALAFAGGVLTLTGGELAPGASCGFAVTLDVPSTAGAFGNTTTAVTGDIGGPVTGNVAGDVLFVEPAPALIKSFLTDPAAAGQSVELEFTITNTDATSAVSDVAFVDELTEGSGDLGPITGFLPFPVSVTLPPVPDPPCGAGSSLALVGLGTDRQGLSLTGGSLAAAGAAGDSCTFKVTIDLPSGLAPRVYTNTTGEITATLDESGEAVTGAPASGTLQVVAPPVLFKEFTDDPAQPDGTVTLQFTLTYDANGDGVIDFDVPGGASDISFTDDLDAVLPGGGLEATGLPVSDVCGTGSTLSGTSVITLSNGSLAADVNDPSTFSCVFSVTLQVPAGAASGSHPNTTSSVAATIEGLSAVGNPASDDLRIAGLKLSKEFTDDPVIAGGTTTLRFTIENISDSEDASAIAFTDDLDEALEDLAAVGGQLPLAGCGGTLSGSAGDTLLSFSGGSLTAGTSCSFDVVLDVPVAAESDTYPNRTSAPTATVGNQQGVIFEAAVDDLVVASNLLLLSKEFTDDPAAPGGSVTLRFTIDNPSGEAVADLAFSDDLGAALPGLAAVGLPVAACGGTLDGTDVIDLTGGSLAGGDSCSFDVTLTVPAGVPVGTVAINTTSEITGTIAGLGVSGDPASDELTIDAVRFVKAFADPVEAGGVVQLDFEIVNLTGATLEELTFTDDLEAVVAGLAAVGLPAADVCGAGSELNGTSEIALSGGTLPPGGSCVITVEVAVPGATAPGDYDNVSSDLRGVGSSFLSPPATDVLTVIEPLDDDGDGVVNGLDVCPDTVIPEAVPSLRLGVNRHALVDGDLVFDTTPPPGGGEGPGEVFTTTDTAGCSCEQIIDELGRGRGHTKYGCSLGTMREWIALVNGVTFTDESGREQRCAGVGCASTAVRPPETGARLYLAVEGRGTVSTGPRGIDGVRLATAVCSSRKGCAVEVQPGTSVKLQARPGGGRWEFSHWEGDCAGSQAILETTVQAGTSCTAVFDIARD